LLGERRRITKDYAECYKQNFSTMRENRLFQCVDGLFLIGRDGIGL
jgi:hypothetical protein